VLVVVANKLPPAIRGRMKLWFIEPRPNVFISGINDSVAMRVIEYLYEHCPADSGVIMFRSIPRSPKYEIRVIGSTDKTITEISGMQLVIEKTLLA
jgi:CRISPR-associated protein Cas2